MDPPAKRPRTAWSPVAQPLHDDDADGDDELIYEPEDVSQMRDPGIQLETSRAFAAHKLKSTWEHIFEKYGRDFTEITDEIDLATGRVITSNGHLENMRHEKDIGIPEDDDEDEGMLLEEASGSEDGNKEDEDEQADQSDEEDEVRILRSKKNGTTNSTNTAHGESVEMQRHSSLSQTMPNTASLGPEQLSSSFATPRRLASRSSYLSTNIWGSRSETIDPVWDSPEIHQISLTESLMSNFRNARYRFPTSSQSVWSSRPDDEHDRMIMKPPRIDMATFSRARAEYTRSARPASTKLLRAFAAQGDNDEEDDDILGVSIAERPVRIPKEIADNKNTDGDNIQEKPLPSVEDAQSHEASAEPISVGISTARKPVMHHSLEIQRKQIWSVGRPKTTPETPAKSQNNAGGVSAADTSVEVDFVTEREAEEVKKYKVTIDLTSEPPRTGYRNEYEDLEDADTAGLMGETPPTRERPDGATLEDASNALAPLTIGEIVTPEFNREAQSEASTTTDEPPAQILEVSKEVFTRYANDNDFPGAEDAMSQERFTPEERERPASPSSKSASPAPVSNGPFSSAIELPKGCLETPPMSIHEQEDNDWILSPMEIDVGEAPKVDQMSGNPFDLPWGSCLWESTEDQSTIKSRPVEEPEDQHLEEKHLDQVAADAPAEVLASSPRSPIATPGELPPLESKEREEDGGFEVIILDDSDESDSSESELEEEPKSKSNHSSEATDFELPISQRPNATPQTPPPRHRQLDAQDQRGATSPLGRLNLDPKTPLSTSGDITIRRHQSPRSSRRYPATRHLVSPEASIQNQTEVASASPAHSPERPPDYNPRTPQSTPGYSTRRSSSQDRTAGQRTSHPHSVRKGSSRGIVARSTPRESTPRSGTPRPSKPRPPHTPRSRKPRCAPAKTPTRSLASLIPDDEDDLTLDTFKSGTKPSSAAFGERKKTLHDSVPLAGRYADITTPTKQRRQTAGGSGTGTTTTAKKRKSVWALAATPTKARPVSPSNSLFRTPGGTKRRCGEDGFQCDKSFCFTCL